MVVHTKPSVPGHRGGQGGRCTSLVASDDWDRAREAFGQAARWFTSSTAAGRGRWDEPALGRAGPGRVDGRRPCWPHEPGTGDRGDLPWPACACGKWPPRSTTSVSSSLSRVIRPQLPSGAATRVPPWGRTRQARWAISPGVAHQGETSGRAPGPPDLRRGPGSVPRLHRRARATRVPLPVFRRDGHVQAAAHYASGQSRVRVSASPVKAGMVPSASTRIVARAAPAMKASGAPPILRAGVAGAPRGLAGERGAHPVQAMNASLGPAPGGEVAASAKTLGLLSCSGESVTRPEEVATTTQ